MNDEVDRQHEVSCLAVFFRERGVLVQSSVWSDHVDQGYAALNDIRELSAVRIVVSVLCLCKAISMAAFNSGTV
jgi:hypothetical protein